MILTTQCNFENEPSQKHMKTIYQLHNSFFVKNKTPKIRPTFGVTDRT